MPLKLYHWATVGDAQATKRRGYFENRELTFAQGDPNDPTRCNFVGVLVSAAPVGAARQTGGGQGAELEVTVSLDVDDLRHYEVEGLPFRDARFWIVPAGVLNPHILEWKILGVEGE